MLITGPAACGKSTLTKQYAHRLVTDLLDPEREGELVPLLVTVIDLAETIRKNKLGEADDILEAHIRRTKTYKPLADFLLARRKEGKLVVILDGVDEVGGEVRGVLEPYVARKLAGEVKLCITGRENGIENTAIFADFEHFHIQGLSKEQQRYIVESRMAAAPGVRAGEVTADERVHPRVHVLSLLTAVV